MGMLSPMTAAHSPALNHNGQCVLSVNVLVPLKSEKKNKTFHESKNLILKLNSNDLIQDINLAEFTKYG